MHYFPPSKNLVNTWSIHIPQDDNTPVKSRDIDKSRVRFNSINMRHTIKQSINTNYFSRE